MLAHMPRIRSRALAVAFCAAVLISAALPIPSASAANPADLDPTFGTNGIATSHLSGGIDAVNDLIVLPDGKIAWAGSMFNQTESKWGSLLGKLTAGGAIDQTFGNSTGNVSRSHFGTGDSFGIALAAQPDGKLVVSGRLAGTPGEHGPGLLARFSAGGELDTSTFAAPDGWMHPTTSVSGAVGIQPSGKILAAGGGNNFSACRVTTTGVSDPTMQGGVSCVSPSFDGDADKGEDMVVLPDGGFVLAGTSQPTFGPNFVSLAKFTEDGAPDASFGGDGTAAAWAPGTYFATDPSIAVQPDGKFVVSMWDYSGEDSTSSTLVRFLANGELDPSFGSNGFAPAPFDGLRGATDLAVQPDGKIVVVARNFVLPGLKSRSLGVGRFLSNGQPDPGFGTGGYAYLRLFPGNAWANAVAVQPDGKIVIGGSIDIADNLVDTDWVVVRLRGDESTIAPAPVPPVPASKISRPKKSSMKRKSLKRISGTAGPSGLVAKVEIAVRRIDSKSLKRKRCVWLRNNRAKFKKNRSTSKKRCTTQVWLRAKGTSKWSFSLKRKKYLPKGSYKIYSRVTLTDGTRQTTFTTKAGNLKKLKLTR